MIGTEGDHPLHLLQRATWWKVTEDPKATWHDMVEWRGGSAAQHKRGSRRVRRAEESGRGRRDAEGAGSRDHQACCCTMVWIEGGKSELRVMRTPPGPFIPFTHLLVVGPGGRARPGGGGGGRAGGAPP